MRNSVASLGMPGKRRLAVLSVVLFGLLSSVFVGCGGPPQVPQPKVAGHMQTLAVLYGQYTGENKGQSPPDEATFKKYISGLPAERLMGKTVDELFISPRDNQPYVVNYKVKMEMPGSGSPPVIAYEQTGSMGKRYIATGLGGVEEVDEARFLQLVPKK